MSPSRSLREFKSSISPNSFLHIPHSPPPPPQPEPKSSDTDTHLIFFIPGNPGLISYYHTFLSLLSDPETSPATAGCVVAGFSLGGFEVSNSTAKLEDGCVDEGRRRGGGPFPFEEEREGKGKGKGKGKLYSLREQIDLTARRVEALVKVLHGQRNSKDDEGCLPHGDDATQRCKVLLIGHSVGAYIALEVLRIHHRLEMSRSPSISLAEGTDKCVGAFDIQAAILLTPTIVDIAQSSSGRVLAPVLRWIPGFPLFVGLAARVITRVLPGVWLEIIVRTVMGSGTPDEAVVSTISFLGSRDGVRQSLGMARDEMREIGGDGWGGEVWGVVWGSQKEAEDGGAKMGKPPKLVFYFAERDHWVADQTREAIIRTRGGKGEVGKPRMVVAQAGELVHGWCMRHNGVVAKKVNGWVEEIIAGR